MLASLAVTALLAASTALSSASPAQQAKAAQPNVVFIIVDDQDARQNTVGTMERIQERLVDEGTVFSRFYAPISGSSLFFFFALLLHELTLPRPHRTPLIYSPTPSRKSAVLLDPPSFALSALTTPTSPPSCLPGVVGLSSTRRVTTDSASSLSPVLFYFRSPFSSSSN